MAKAHRTLPPFTDQQAARFWAKVAEAGPNDCWPWTRWCLPRGYGIWVPGLKQPKFLTHRVAWFFAHGPIPDGLKVLHRCDNPPCCNPVHLFLGTQLDNMRDAAHKGRVIAGEAHPWHSRDQKGEKNHQSKLTEQQVRDMRAEFAAGATIRAIADRRGICRKYVWAVVHRRLWKHVV